MLREAQKTILTCHYTIYKISTYELITGHSFSGGNPESIKWKKLPKTVNAVSKMSGARILAVGFSAEDSKKKDTKSSPEKKVEPVVEGVSHSKELKKLWTEAMLLPEDKEPPLVEWNSVRFNQENNSDNKCESFKQEGKDKSRLNLPTPEEKEKVIKIKNLENLCAKQVSNNKPGSISSNVSDATPYNTSVNTLVTANNSTLTSDVVVNITNYSCPMTTNITSEGMVRHPSTERSQSSDDLSVISEVEPSRKMTNYGRKIRLGGMMTESPMESQRLPIASIEAPKKAPKSTFSNRKLKSKQKKNSWNPNSISQGEITHPSTFASQLMQDAELRQEHESDESWSHMNNITLYRADGTDSPEKCELSVTNVNPQPLNVTQSSATHRPNLPKSSQFIQKSSSVKYQLQTGKSGARQAVYRMPRVTDKRRLKLQNELIALSPRDTRAKISVHEGTLIVGYQCPKCSKIFQTEWLMMKHSVTHFKYRCDICYQVYPDENMMKIHLLDHLSGAYEDEKYYCQFSCKVCHSLKCGCYEPTYCKPKDLPRVFFRPQKAKRSKRSFTSKLNTGPNDHLKITMSAYKKMISGSVGLPSKERAGTSTSSKPTHVELTQNSTLLQNSPKSAAASDSQKPILVFKETKVSNTLPEAPKSHHIERDQEYVPIKVETNDPSLPKETGLGASHGVSDLQFEARPNSGLEEKDSEKEKQLNWNEVRTKYIFDSKRYAVNLGISKPTEADEKAAKRGRKRPSKFSKNSPYEDTVFYQMCEICDASFSTKSELSEHMFLHRLKSRSRRGEKRNLSSDPKETESPKKIKVYSIMDQASSETVAEGPDKCTCDLCQVTFTTKSDYRAHQILAHKEPKADSGAQYIEVYRCKYCEKVYRRRRELKRHLKRDCTAAPASLRGMLSGLSYSGNVIEDAHYTTLKIDLDDKPDTPPKSSGKGLKGPIVCKYCSAVTKREAEMKRHIWKFCLKVPVDVVKKFMDGASLRELGFKCMKDGEESVENTDMEESNSSNMEIPDALNSLDETASTVHSSFSKGFSPKKISPANTKIPPVKANMTEELNSTVQSLHEKIETSVQPEPSGNQNISMIHLEDVKKTHAQPETSAKQGQIEHLSKKVKMQPSATVNDTEESSTSATPLVTSVMQFPIVLPVMAASAKSKRPLVCGYCGIWYFREMAILKHMKERCIKIPELEKELLKNNSALCNVTQRGGIASENGAVYKMVKVPEHLQNTPVPMPKDVSNEDIKELNANIKAFRQNAPAKSADAKVAHVQDSLSSLSTVVKEQNNLSSSTEGKRQDRLSSSPAEVKEQGILSPSPIKVKEQTSSSSRKVKEQDSMLLSLRNGKEDRSSTPRKVKEKDSPSPSPRKVKEQDSSSSSPQKVKEQDSLSSPRKAKEQGSLSRKPKEQDSLSSPRKVTEKDTLSSSPRRVKEQDSLSSLRVREQNNLSSSYTKVNKKDSTPSLRKVKEQDSSSSPIKVEEQDSPSPSNTKVREQNNLSSSRTRVKKKDSQSSSRVVREQDIPSSSPRISEQDSSPKVKGQGSPSSSPNKVKEQDSLSSSSVVKNQDISSLSPTQVKDQDTPSSSPTKVRDQDCPSPSPTEASEQGSLTSPFASPVKVNKTTTTKRGSRCRRCHEHFKSQEAVLAHSSVHHGPKKGFYKCKLCHARLAKYKQLREHVWEHTDENPYRCHLCGVKYRSSDALVDHLHTIHQFTSIYEKNLYKWLPGRHGRYREIKPKHNSSEEKLDDMDTTLDSLAEVMVITDKDICSKPANGKGKASKGEMNEQSGDSESMQEGNKSLLLKDSKSSTDNALDNNKPQNKKMPSSSSMKISTASNVSSNEGGKAVNIKKAKLSMGDQNLSENGVEKITRGSQSVKNAAALKDSKDKGRTPQSDDVSKNKSESHVNEQNKIDGKTEGKVPEKNPQSRHEEDFIGEGFLPLIGNLDSVVETVHLTDEVLS